MTYVHRRSDWPDFRFDYEEVASLLGEVRRKQGSLVGRMRWLGFELKETALLQALSADVLKSSEIEGEFLHPDQVRSSVARRMGMELGGLVPSDRRVDGVVDMMLDATQRFDEALTKERLFEWHRLLFPDGMSGGHRILTGSWRDDSTGPMQVVSGFMGRERVHFQAPPASVLDNEMETFLLWFNGEQKLDPVVKAALAHLWFVTVHPFDDGNGRVARALADLLLTKAEGLNQRFYSMSAQIRVERNAYYKILEDTQKGDLDVTEWVVWFLNCLLRALDASERSLEGIFQKAKFWENNKTVSMNERQTNMVNRLLDGFFGNLTSSKWAKMCKCSSDTALRDINDLIEKGVLSKDKSGGRSTSYLLVLG